MSRIKDETLELAMEYVDDCSGICLKCGYLQDGVEPDARKYECEACGAHAVYGCEEIILMGV